MSSWALRMGSLRTISRVWSSPPLTYEQLADISFSNLMTDSIHTQYQPQDFLHDITKLDINLCSCHVPVCMAFEADPDLLAVRSRMIWLLDAQAAKTLLGLLIMADVNLFLHSMQTHRRRTRWHSILETKRMLSYAAGTSLKSEPF